MLKALWAYRGFIFGSVRREFQAKYSNSLLGAAWTVINPLAMIVVYTVVFSQIMRAKLPGVDSQFAYSIYLCAGVLTWTFFSETVGRAQNVFLARRYPQRARFKRREALALRRRPREAGLRDFEAELRRRIRRDLDGGEH